ncbi:MAG TPA: hypothetical protein VMS21_15230 [Methylomirabilota bacterium]|nr:hypothetical protein [Methylomirabilota bacterium]
MKAPCTTGLCRMRNLLTWTLLVGFLWMSNRQVMMAAELRAGAASVIITPPPGTPMAGYYHFRAAEGVHDDLHSKALVLEYGDTRAALVALDLISTQRPFVEQARRLIETATGIPGSNVMISATHAHTGPVLSGGSTRSEAMEGDNDLAAEYLKSLPRLIADSVAKANSALTPVNVSAGIGNEPTLTFNRRFHMRDGSVGWNPGKLNPDIVKPAGPIDPEVPAAYFRTHRDQPVAAYVNYALHLDTVGGLEISADYPHTLSRLLADVKGSGLITLFTIGTAGDLNHINVQSATRQKGHGEAARIGTLLAAEVLQTLESARELEGNALPIRVHSELVKLPLPSVDEDDVTKARNAIVRRGGDQKPSFLESVNAFKVLDVYARLGEPWEVEVQVITLGREIAWVSLPGEIFVELGLDIKRGSPFPVTVIAELANGSIGYVPTRVAYSQGNYEVVSARCAEGSGELLVDAAVRLLKELYRQKSALNQND